MSAGQARRGWNWLITRTREKPRPRLRAALLVRPRNFREGTLANQNDIVKGNYLMSKKARVRELLCCTSGHQFWSDFPSILL
jgi:hypothetical protein